MAWRIDLATNADASERALRQAEQLFRAAFENAPIGMALVGLDGRFKRVNRLLCEIVGLDEAYLLARTFQDITHSDDLEADLEHVRALLAGETTTYAMEKRYIHASGEFVWTELHVSLVRDDDGAPVHFVSQIRDISSQRAAEAHLARYRAVVEFAEDAVVATDFDGRILTWNRGAERLFGYDSGDALAQSIALLQPADRIGEVDAINGEIAAGRTIERLETRRRRRDGGLVIVQITVSGARRRGPRRRRLDDRPRRHAGRARRALAHAARTRPRQGPRPLRPRPRGGDGVRDHRHGLHGHRHGLQHRCRADAGYRARDLVGHATLVALHDAAELAERAQTLGIEPGFAVLAATARDGGTETREWTYVRKDASRVAVSVTVTAQRERGLMTGFLAIATDITDVKRAEGARRDAEERFRGAFEHAPIGVALVAADGPEAGTIVRANRALEDLVGGDAETLAGRDVASLARAEDRGGLAATIARLLAGAESVHGEQRLIAADGHDIWTLLSGSLVQGSEAGRGRQAVIQVLDISERKTFEGRLQHLADHDALTGLVNRRRFEDELDRALAHAERYGSKGAVILLDLDGFKYINDALGHSVGDEPTVALLRRLGVDYGQGYHLGMPVPVADVLASEHARAPPV